MATQSTARTTEGSRKDAGGSAAKASARAPRSSATAAAPLKPDKLTKAQPTKAEPKKVQSKKVPPKKVQPKKVQPEKSRPTRAKAGTTATAAKKAATRSAAAKKSAATPAAAKNAASRPAAAKKAASKTTAAKKAASGPAAAKKAATTSTAASKAPKRSTPAKASGTAAAAERWTAAELGAVRSSLEEELEQLSAEYTRAMADLENLTHQSRDGAGDDQADAGTKTFEREQEMSLANNRLELLTQTRRAISQLDAGTYGRCESCGNPIAKARLQAYPSATLCVTCKQREERR